MSSTGTVAILSVGGGDVRLSFKSQDPVETDRARRAVTDMLARGYVLFVESPEGLRKVESFDPEAEVYILADVPGHSLPPPPDPEEAVAPPEAEPCRPRRGRPPKARVPAGEANVTAIAPTAGG